MIYDRITAEMYEYVVYDIYVRVSMLLRWGARRSNCEISIWCSFNWHNRLRRSYKPLWNLRHVAWRGTELFVSAPARRYGSRPKQPPVGGSQFRFFLSMPKARMNCEEVVSVVIVTVV